MRNCLLNLARISVICLFALGMGVQVLLAQTSRLSKINKSNIAVWDFSLEGIAKSESRAVTNRLRSELVNTGLFRVMSRDQIKKLIGEIQLGQTLGDPSEAIEAGKLKGVKYVVTGALVAVTNAIQITVEMIDGTTAEIVKSITPRAYQGDMINFLDVEVPFLAGELAGVERERFAGEREPFSKPVIEKSVWPLYLGIIATAAGLALLDEAHKTNDDAEEKADLARQSTNLQLFEEAKDDRDEAEREEFFGFVTGGIGLLALLHYFDILESPAVQAAQTNPRKFTRPTMHMEVGPRSVMAGYALRW